MKIRLERKQAEIIAVVSLSICTVALTGALAMNATAMAAESQPTEGTYETDAVFVNEQIQDKPLTEKELEGHASLDQWKQELTRQQGELSKSLQNAKTKWDGHLTENQLAWIENTTATVFDVKTLKVLGTLDFELKAIENEAQQVKSDKEQASAIEAERLAKEEEEAAAAAAAAANNSSNNGGTYYSAPSGGGVLTRSGGVNMFNGYRETWYSQKVLPGGGLNIPGRHVASDGTIRDADDYIVVASVDFAKGTVVQTSLGPAKVYDSGCAPGTIDIYTNW